MLIPTIVTIGLVVGKAAPRMSSLNVQMGLHELSATTMDGTDLDLSAFSGKPVVALNVASRWGATGKVYKQIAAWNAEYKSDATFLLFPSDEFGGQELPADEIAPFLNGFKLTKDLPLAGDGCYLMQKTTVNGDDAHPVFALGKAKFEGDVAWNFAGIFVFNKAGECTGRFDAKQLKELGAALTEAMA